MAKKLKQYMLYHSILLIAKLDPINISLKSLHYQKKITRWKVLLFEYNIAYISQKVIKKSVIAKFLANRAVEDYEPMKFDFPNEELMAILESKKDDDDDEETWWMYFNRVANAMKHRIEVVLISLTEHYYPITARLNFNTNNVATYETCIMGLHAILDRKIKIVKVFRDSTLVIYQLKENQIADALATLVVMYLNQTTENNNRVLRRLAMGFFLDGETLYKRGKDQVLLHCVNISKAKRIVEEVHNGVYKAHTNGHIMARQVI
ncbi:uncharacterized protein LOC111294733 [Durio zibethinus]|uniref:Uncharacterized protein LOC111294733 n=1 Tax=Durio zibethinus TaxID=66656 RepID=A0A6P5YTM9_DURZI|nr:uncharacterized protein LOC111294733 [Durio zibethinus]